MSGIKERIQSEIDKVRVVDTHEHIMPESERDNHALDFSYLFAHYNSSDLISAGMPPALMEAVRLPMYRYRIAMNDRDVTALRSLVASNYYENASTTDDTSDDYGNEKLGELFTDYLGDSVQEVRYDMDIKRLARESEMVHVDYAYAWNFRYTSEGRDHWKSERDVNRLTLVQEDGAWKIAAGL